MITKRDQEIPRLRQRNQVRDKDKQNQTDTKKNV